MFIIRTLLPGLLCCVGIASLKAVEPTAERLDTAKKAFAKHGADYFTDVDSRTKQTRHIFIMPMKTTDAELKGDPRCALPILPAAWKPPKLPMRA